MSALSVKVESRNKGITALLLSVSALPVFSVHRACGAFWGMAFGGVGARDHKKSRCRPSACSFEKTSHTHPLSHKQFMSAKKQTPVYFLSVYFITK